MPRHTTPLPRRLADRVTSSRASAARAAATVGLTTAALLVGVGGYAVTTSPVLATAPGDRFSLAEAEVAAPSGLEAAAAARAAEEASRAERAPLAEGLPATSAEAQSWVDEVGDLQVVLDAKAAEEEAARVAAAKKAAAEKKAAEEEAARVAAEKAAAEKKAAEEEAARVAAEEEAARAAAEQAAAEQAAADERAREEAEAARSADRGSVDPGSNRGIAQSMLGDYGWGGEQWSCLDQLWQKESGWNQFADNPSSSAYGIPQALPGSKMSSAGSDWETNPATQIRWGLGYIDGRYGSPCAAWQHSVDNNWY